MAEDGKIVYKVVVDSDGVVESAESAGKKAGGALNNVMTGAARRVGAALVEVGAKAASAAANFVKDSIKVGSEFESAMSQVAATLGYSTEEIEQNLNGAGDAFEALQQKALEMGRSTIYTSKQAAEGLNILAMSGYDAEQSIAMIEDVLHLAAAGGMDLAQAASYISGAMKGFADDTKDAQYYADLMALGATLADTSVQELGDALSGSAASAYSYSQSAKTTTIALLRLAEQGEHGSAAATALAAAMKNIYAPMDQAKKAMQELGVNAFDPATGAAREFNTVVDELNAALAGYSDEQRSAYLQTIFGIQGFDAFNKMVVTSTEKQNEWSNAIDNATGAAEKQYNTMTDNLEGDMAALNSAVEGVKIALAEQLTPAIREAMPEVTAKVGELTEKINGMDFSGVSDAISGLADHVFDFASYLLENGDQVISIIEGIGAGFLAWKGITVVKEIAGALGDIFSFVSGIGSALGIGAGAAAGGIAIAGVGVASLVDFAHEMSQVGYLGDGHELAEYAENVKGFEAAIADFHAKNDEYMQSGYTEGLEAMRTELGMLEQGLQHAKEEYENMASSQATAQKATETTTAKTKEAAKVSEDVKTSAETINDTVNETSDGIIETVGETGDTIVSDFDSSLGEMSSVANSQCSALNSTLNSNMTAIAGNATVWGSHIMQNLAAGILSGHSTYVMPAIEKVAEDIAKDLEHSTPEEGPLAHDDTWMPDMMKSFAEGIHDYAPLVTDAVEEAFSGMPSFFGAEGESERNISNNIAISSTPISMEIVVPLFVDSTEIARATAFAMGEQLAWEEM